MTPIEELEFGYRHGTVPAEVPAAWGARAIVTQDGMVDIPWDRTDCIGRNSDRGFLLAWLNDYFPPLKLQRVLSAALQDYNVDTRGDVEYQLYADDKIRVVGSAQSSAGYFYITAYLLEGS